MLPKEGGQRPKERKKTRERGDGVLGRRAAAPWVRGRLSKGCARA